MHTDTPVAIRDLSEQLAAWENGLDRSEVTPKDRKRVYTALHQTHLPSMDSSGVVTYDKNRGVVSLTEQTRDFDIYLNVVSKNELPWSQFYLAIGSLFAAFVSLGALSVPPFAMLGGYVYAFIVTLAFIGVALYHTVSDGDHRLGSQSPPPDACPPPRETAEIDHE
jgi:hypothetical protein